MVKRRKNKQTALREIIFLMRKRRMIMVFSGFSFSVTYWEYQLGSTGKKGDPADAVDTLHQDRKPIDEDRVACVCLSPSTLILLPAPRVLSPGPARSSSLLSRWRASFFSASHIAGPQPSTGGVGLSQLSQVLWIFEQGIPPAPLLPLYYIPQ